MVTINRSINRSIIFLLAVFLVASGYNDLDWMVVSYRYSEWHRTVSYWEFAPGMQLPWWPAYMFDLARLCLGCFLLGFLFRSSS